MRRLGSGIAAALIASFASVAAADGAATPTPAAIVAAVRAQHSVHYDVAASFAGGGVRVDGDAAVGQGIQRITYTKSGRSGHVTVIVVANIAYLRGDVFTLRNYLGFAAAAAARYAGRWVRLAPTTPGFGPIAEAVRLDSSFVGNLDLPRALRRVGTAHVDGQSVFRLAARRSGGGHVVNETIYVRANGPALPVEQQGEGNGATFDAHYGRWNEPVHLTAPAHSVMPS